MLSLSFVCSVFKCQRCVAKGIVAAEIGARIIPNIKIALSDLQLGLLKTQFPSSIFHLLDIFFNITSAPISGTAAEQVCIKLCVCQFIEEYTLKSSKMSL